MQVCFAPWIRHGPAPGRMIDIPRKSVFAYCIRVYRSSAVPHSLHIEYTIEDMTLSRRNPIQNKPSHRYHSRYILSLIDKVTPRQSCRHTTAPPGRSSAHHFPPAPDDTCHRPRRHRPGHHRASEAQARRSPPLYSSRSKRYSPRCGCDTIILCSLVMRPENSRLPLCCSSSISDTSQSAA